MLAERSGLRIHEVPVDWVDDPDSRVDLVATAVADLKGIARVGRALATGRLPVRELSAQLRGGTSCRAWGCSAWATVLRLVLLREWVFRRAPLRASGEQ